MAEPKVSAPAEVSKMMNGATKTVLVVEDNAFDLGAAQINADSHGQILPPK